MISFFRDIIQVFLTFDIYIYFFFYYLFYAYDVNVMNKLRSLVRKHSFFPLNYCYSLPVLFAVCKPIIIYYWAQAHLLKRELKKMEEIKSFLNPSNLIVKIT